jgi:hypothetical protein
MFESCRAHHLLGLWLFAKNEGQPGPNTSPQICSRWVFSHNQGAKMFEAFGPSSRTWTADTGLG